MLISNAVVVIKLLLNC